METAPSVRDRVWILYDWYYGKVAEGKFVKAFDPPDIRPVFELASEGGAGELFGDIYKIVHVPTGFFYIGLAKNSPRYRDYESPSMGRFQEGHWYDRGRKNKAGEQRKMYAFMNTTEKDDWPGPHDVEGATLDVVLYALESVWGKAEGADPIEQNFDEELCLNSIGFLGGHVVWYLIQNGGKRLVQSFV